jgi:hypothetical protein
MLKFQFFYGIHWPHPGFTLGFILLGALIGLQFPSNYHGLSGNTPPHIYPINRYSQKYHLVLPFDRFYRRYVCMNLYFGVGSKLGGPSRCTTWVCTFRNSNWVLHLGRYHTYHTELHPILIQLEDILRNITW